MSTELALVSDKELIGYLDNLGLTSKLNDGEKNTYISIAKAFGLNPFKREIHVSKYGDNLSIITGYEVYIKRAERSGQLDGWNAVTSGSVATGDLKATVTIHRKDRSHPFVWEALYEECVQRTNAGAVTKFWQKAAFMTKKVAISQAFRLCFSDELGGMPYTADEVNEPEQTYDVQHEVVVVLPDLNPSHKSWKGVIKKLKDGQTIDIVKQHFSITPENEQLLNDAASIIE